MEYKVAPSLLAADFTRLGEQVHEIEEAGAPYLHLDVMDGAFVPSISFGLPVLKSLRKVTNMTFDVHMMEISRSVNGYLKPLNVIPFTSSVRGRKEIYFPQVSPFRKVCSPSIRYRRFWESTISA